MPQLTGASRLAAADSTAHGHQEATGEHARPGGQDRQQQQQQQQRRRVRPRRNGRRPGTAGRRGRTYWDTRYCRETRQCPRIAYNIIRYPQPVRVWPKSIQKRP